MPSLRLFDDTVGSMSWVRAAAALLLVAGSFWSGGVASAQDENDGPTITPVAQTESEVEGAEDVDFDENQAGIDRARRLLIAIAVVMAVALVAYWWHTIPSRRLRIAAERLADQRSTVQHGDPDDSTS